MNIFKIAKLKSLSSKCIFDFPQGYFHKDYMKIDFFFLLRDHTFSLLNFLLKVDIVSYIMWPFCKSVCRSPRVVLVLFVYIVISAACNMLSDFPE